MNIKIFSDKDRIDETLNRMDAFGCDCVGDVHKFQSGSCQIQVTLTEKREVTLCFDSVWNPAPTTLRILNM